MHPGVQQVYSGCQDHDKMLARHDSRMCTHTNGISVIEESLLLKDCQLGELLCILQHSTLKTCMYYVLASSSTAKVLKNLKVKYALEFCQMSSDELAEISGYVDLDTDS